MTVGGAAPPRAMIEAFGERHGLKITQGWGMTEMCPIGTISGPPGQERGLAAAAVTRGAPSRGRRPVRRGARARRPRGSSHGTGSRWASSRCAGPRSLGVLQGPDDRRSLDGRWLVQDGRHRHDRPDGYVQVQDRSKDLVKSGGEWIRTVALENALMGHPAVAEAAVIPVPDEKWSERPLAVVVLREGGDGADDELRDFLAPQFAKFWLPDRFEYVDEIPRPLSASSGRPRCASSSRPPAPSRIAETRGWAHTSPPSATRRWRSSRSTTRR